MRQSNAVAHNGLHHQSRKPDRRPGGDTPTKNIWTPDSEVKVGYMTLRVVKRIPTPGDGNPDKWALTSLDGTRDYVFAPYSGLRLTADRRPKAGPRPSAAQPLPLARSVAKARAETVAKVAVTRATSDEGRGRQPKPAVSLSRAPTQSERLDRLEALLLSVAERIGPADLTTGRRLEDTPPARLRRAS